MREIRWRPFGRHHLHFGPTTLLFLLQWASQALSCFSSAPRQVAYGGSRTPYAYSGYGGDGGGGGGGGRPTIIVNGPGAGPQAARAAPNLPLSPIGTNNQLVNSRSAHALLGNRVAIADFDSDGFNAQGGGPVSNGNSLNCDFEGQPCCWANVPSPSDDQIDWQLVQGRPDSQQFRNISMDGRYLVAYASGAAPSDEAQLSSCAIACASSPIRVRARHWQSYNVLLQVCQRESFPPSLGFNPLLNCQEFPSANQVAHTELVLPKASYVDIIFVASNFIDERGDIVFLDDIEVLYESQPPDCGVASVASTGSYSGPSKAGKTPKPAAAVISRPAPTGNRIDVEPADGEDGEELGIRRSKTGGAAVAAGTSGAASGAGLARELVGTGGGPKTVHTTGIDGETAAAIRSEGSEQISGTGSNNLEGGISHGSSSSSSKAHGVTGKSASSLASSASKATKSSSSSSLNVIKKTSSSSKSTSSSSSSASSASSSSSIRQLISASKACPKMKCSFEDGTSCSYLDTTEPESAVRGLTTRFEVVKGQFMNRVTGVKEGTEGNYYAAVFLYPREKAGLWADVGDGALAEDTRLRFQYYEGTHGVQLKGCCVTGGGTEEADSTHQQQQRVLDEELACPFQSDKFVSVSDRMWKWGSFVCPQGTRKVIFLCENTRTNQGACAMDDIAVVENRPDVSMQDRPIC